MINNQYKKEISSLFVKGGGSIIYVSNIVDIDITEIENLIIKVSLTNDKVIIIKDLEAIEFLMQVKPSAMEGRRLFWAKNVWFIHNVFGHPLTQFFAMLGFKKLAFWIHDVTVPKPIGKRKSK